MEEIKKVKVEIVDDKPKKENKYTKAIKRYWFKLKIGIAIFLDGIDLFIAWIPIVNILWDIACFIILLVILKNKKLALLSLVELPLIGLPPFSIIDMFLPICTICVLMDNNEARIIIKRFNS